MRRLFAALVLAVLAAGQSHAQPLATRTFDGVLSEARPDALHVFTVPAGRRVAVALSHLEGSLFGTGLALIVVGHERRDMAADQRIHEPGDTAVFETTDDTEVHLWTSRFGPSARYAFTITEFPIGDGDPIAGVDSAAPGGAIPRLANGVAAPGTIAAAATPEDSADQFLIGDLPPGAVVRVTVDRVTGIVTGWNATGGQVAEHQAGGVTVSLMWEAGRGAGVAAVLDPQATFQAYSRDASAGGEPAILEYTVDHPGRYWAVVTRSYGASYDYRIKADIERGSPLNLSFVDRFGEPIDKTPSAQPVWLALDMPGGTASPTQDVYLVNTALAESSQTPQTLTLKRQEQAGVKDAVRFISPPLAFLPAPDVAAWEARQQLDRKLRLDIFEPDRSVAAARDLYGGPWKVLHTTRRGTNPYTEPVTGRAVVAGDGESAALEIEIDGRQRSFVSREIQANRGGLAIRFREVGATDAPFIARGEDVQAFDLPRSGTTVRAEWWGHLAATLDVTLPDAKSGEDLRVSLARNNGTRLDGHWMFEKDGQLTGGGQASWTSSDEKIVGVLVLDDQADPKHAAPPAGEDRLHRRLLVYGHGLPVSGASVRQIESPLAGIGYRLHRIVRESHDDYAEAWRRAGVTRPERFDALELTARLPTDEADGQKLLRINGLEGRWDFFSARHLLSALGAFVRGDEHNVAKLRPSDRFYDSEEVLARLRFEEAPSWDEATLTLYAGSEANRLARALGTVTARQVAAKPTVFLSDRLALVLVLGAQREVDEDATPIELREGETHLTAVVEGPPQAVVSPMPFSAAIASPPDRSPWERALARAAACLGETFDPADADAFAFQPARTERASVLGLLEAVGQLENEGVVLAKGDLAAAILIREAFTRRLHGIEQRYLRAGTSRESAAKLMEEARALGVDRSGRHDFWDQTVTYGDGPGLARKVEVPLFMALDGARMRAHHDLNDAVWQINRWALEEVQAAARKEAETVRRGFETVMRAGPCDVGMLLAFAGTAPRNVVSEVVARMVMRIEDGSWVQDDVAIAFVEGIGGKAGAVKGLKRIEKAWDTLVAASVGVTSVVLVAASGGLAAPVYAAIALDALDAGYFGLKGFIQHHRNNEIYRGLRGARTVIGDAAVDAAKEPFGSGAMATLGFAAPMLSGALNMHELSNLGAVRAISRGRRLANGFDGPIDARRVAGLSNLERRDLAAYLIDLESRRTSALRRANEAKLTRRETRHLDEYAKLRPNPKVDADAFDTAGAVGTNATSQDLARAGGGDGVARADAAPATGTGEGAGRTQRLTREELAEAAGEGPGQTQRLSREELAEAVGEGAGRTQRLSPEQLAEAGAANPALARSEASTNRLVDDAASEASTHRDLATLGEETRTSLTNAAPDVKIGPAANDNFPAGQWMPEESRLLSDAIGDGPPAGWLPRDGTDMRWQTDAGAIDTAGEYFARGGFADVHRMLDEAGNPIGLLNKRFTPETGNYGTRGVRHQSDNPLTPRSQREVVAASVHGADVLKRHDILFADIVDARLHGQGGNIIQRQINHNLPAGVESEVLLSEALRHGPLSGAQQDAVAGLFNRMDDARILMEDPNRGNLFLRQHTTGRWEAGIVDTDRIGLFNELDPRLHREIFAAAREAHGLSLSDAAFNPEAARRFNMLRRERKRYFTHTPENGIGGGFLDADALQRNFGDLQGHFPPRIEPPEAGSTPGKQGHLPLAETTRKAA